MRFKGTLILLIVCLALGAFVYFYEIKGGEEREKAEQAEKQIWHFEDKDIQQIDFIFPDRQITAERRGEEEWFLTNPRQLEADSDELNRLARSAAKIERESIVEPNATDLAKFGLDPFQSSLKLKTGEGKEHTVFFGNNNPTGNSAYAVLPDQKEVFLVSSSVVNSFDKKLEELRNHSVLDFKQQDVQSLSLKNPEGDFKLTKDGEDRWWIDGAERIAADSPGIRGILNALSMANIKEFFDENQEDYVNLGLGKPLIDVSLTYGPDKAIKHLAIGSEKSKIRSKAGQKLEQKDSGQTGEGAAASPSETYLAKDESREDLFFVDKDLVEKLLQSRNDLRDKALASFQRWDIDSMSLTNPQGSFDFSKTGGEWFIGKEKKKAKWDAVNGILDALEKKATEWIDKPGPLQTYGLEPPAIHIILKQGSKVIVDCSLSKGKKEDTVYARIQGESSVKVADPESFSLLDKGDSDLVEPPETDASKTESVEE
jgi:hypothetical protein